MCLLAGCGSATDIDAEDVWDDDSAYIEMLANEGARLREKTERAAAGDDVSELSEESEIDEELGYISPLDIVDPYITFKQALTSTCSAVNSEVECVTDTVYQRSK